MTARVLQRTGGLLPLVWLTLVWVLLWGRFTLGNLVSGVVVALAVTLLLPLPRVSLGARPHLLSTVRLATRFVADLLVSSIDVAWQSIRPSGQDVSSVVAVQLRSDSELLMAMTLEAVCLVPGSLVVELDPKTRMLYAHTLSAEDDEAVEAMRRNVLAQEARIIRAVGRPEDLALLDADVSPEEAS